MWGQKKICWNSPSWGCGSVNKYVWGGCRWKDNVSILPPIRVSHENVQKIKINKCNWEKYLQSIWLAQSSFTTVADSETPFRYVFLLYVLLLLLVFIVSTGMTLKLTCWPTDPSKHRANYMSKTSNSSHTQNKSIKTLLLSYWYFDPQYVSDISKGSPTYFVSRFCILTCMLKKMYIEKNGHSFV